MSIESTRATMIKYFEDDDAAAGLMTDDVVYTRMATGEEHRGKAAVLAMLHKFYAVSFSGKVETKNIFYADQRAVGEWDYVGKHIGEFEGIAATGKDVRVPLCVVYDLESDKIKRARIYFEMPVLLRQLGITAARQI
jgi:steroid delta-isomerase-like uncharacterized protein